MQAKYRWPSTFEHSTLNNSQIRFFFKVFTDNAKILYYNIYKGAPQNS